MSWEGLAGALKYHDTVADADGVNNDDVDDTDVYDETDNVNDNDADDTDDYDVDSKGRMTIAVLKMRQS